MATDTQAMGLLIRMMPLMVREFSLRVDPMQFFADSGYATSVLAAADDAKEPRLRDYATQLRQRMSELGAGPPGAVRSASAPSQSAAVPAPAPDAPPPKKYTRTLR